MSKPLFKAEKAMESTDNEQTAIPHQSPWLGLRLDKDVVPGRAWAFTDGSSSGWYAATILRPNNQIRYLADVSPPVMNNVGPEMNGLLLALRHLPEGEACNIVHDYMGVGAWLTGSWNANKPAAVELVAKAKQIIKERGLQPHFIHHGGHQKDDSDFTYWNNFTDRHCTLQAVLDVTMPWSEAMLNREKARKQ